MPRDYKITMLPATPKSDIDYASDLNDQQFAAVTAPPGPTLVIAGAGSGKTRTLTYRVAYLLDNGIFPANILLLTFTNKAAREMLERVEALVPHDTKELWGGTFHSVGNKILRRHAEKVGFQRNFSIMDRDDQKDLLVATLAESGIKTSGVRFPKPEVVADVFSLTVNMDSDIREMLDWKYPYYSHLEEELSNLHDLYEEKKEGVNSMDFDDLLVKTLEVLRDNPEICAYYQRQFEWVLVDEYQDTNQIQNELVSLLAAPQNNIMAVGDDAQSIYSWRGADFRNILSFPDVYEKTRQFPIETNYRSVPEILTVANAAIAPNELQFEKKLAAHRDPRGELPGLIPLPDAKTQAVFVAQRVLELHEADGIDYNEMAVLYRAHYQSMDLQMEFTSRKIPFQITSGLRFFEQAHIKDIAAFMKFASNRKDEMALKRVVKMLPGIGPGTADKVWNFWIASEDSARERLDSFSATLIQFKPPGKAREAWKQFCYTMDELLDGEGGLMAPAKMITSIVEGVYDDYMKSKFPNYENRRQDVHQLQKYSEGFDDVNEYLSQLSLLAGQDAVEAAKEEKETDFVSLSSVHQAKGLEYKVVFVIWLADGMFPGNRVIEACERDDSEEQMEEERRLFYVAITRAKDLLYLTYPKIWQGAFNGQVIQHPSRFLDDIPYALVEEWNVGRPW